MEHPGPNASNLNIRGNDSIYIFVNVLIPKGAETQSLYYCTTVYGLVIMASEQFIQLSAWGQNAHFLKNAEIKSDTVWTNDLPYVIYGGLTIDSNATLTIQSGTHIYMHADAPVYVDGSLNVLGESPDSLRVYFTGDRLDHPYASYPGSWPGIYFSKSSKDNVLNLCCLFKTGTIRW